MTITQLDYIISVNTFGSFSDTARHCFVTQPALSAQIQKLEDELGLQIFDRSKQLINPTEKGRKIIKQAKIVVLECEKILSVIPDDLKQNENSLLLH